MRALLAVWWPDLLIMTGASLALVGVYLLLGFAWLLVLAGVLAVVYGVWADLCR